MPINRRYVDSRNEKLVHAKPSTQPGIIIYYYDKNGVPAGRCHAATVAEFNRRFKLQPRKAASVAQAA